jgi:hypothetical protein
MHTGRIAWQRVACVLGVVHILDPAFNLLNSFDGKFNEIVRPILY